MDARVYVKPAARLVPGEQWLWCGRWLTVEWVDVEGESRAVRQRKRRRSVLVHSLERYVAFHYWIDEEVTARRAVAEEVI